MKQLISEEFIDFKLLTSKQKEEVEHMREVREEAFHNLLSVRQNELLERKDELMERMAKAAGFAHAKILKNGGFADVTL